MTSVPRVAVLGQGLAGTLVSLGLRQNAVPHHAYDAGHSRASSYAAAGIVNPVTGRRFVLVEGYESYVAQFGVYAQATELLGRPFLHPLTIYRDLSQTKDRNQWDLRRLDAAYAPFLGEPLRPAAVGLPPKLATTWLGPTRDAYRVDMAGLIAAYRVLLKSERTLHERTVTHADLRRKKNAWELGGRLYSHVVDCRGAGSAASGPWDDLPWRLSKGEALRLRNASWPPVAATKIGGMFVCPVGDGTSIWYGGTSTDHFADAAPDHAVGERLRQDLRELALLDDATGNTTTVATDATNDVEHLVAVRPTMRDRATRALRHPTLPGLYLCNGFGTKGALVGPSVAAELWSILRADLGVAP